jgi:cytidylate kinase
MAIISISRGTASGGRALAEIVARQLGYPCVSREAIRSSKDWYAIPMDVPSTSAEEPASYWDRLTTERTAYIESFRTALCERATRGNLVYHGHAGHMLLPGIPVLRVRVVADMTYRVDAVVREQGLTHADAITYIDKADKERREWVRYLYNVEWDDATLYDVMLNLSHLSLDGACSTLVHMARLEEYKPTPRSLKAIEDLARRGKIAVALARDSRTASAGLEVKVLDGVVTISGTAKQQVLDALPSVVGMVDTGGNIRYRVSVPSRQDA